MNIETIFATIFYILGIFYITKSNTRVIKRMEKEHIEEMIEKNKEILEAETSRGEALDLCSEYLEELKNAHKSLITKTIKVQRLEYLLSKKGKENEENI